MKETLNEYCKRVHDCIDGTCEFSKPCCLEFFEKYRNTDISIIREDILSNTSEEDTSPIVRIRMNNLWDILKREFEVHLDSTKEEVVKKFEEFFEGE